MFYTYLSPRFHDVACGVFQVRRLFERHVTDTGESVENEVKGNLQAGQYIKIPSTSARQP